MYLTIKNQLRGLSIDEYSILKELCHLSKNLYNEALYNVRQYYFTEHKYLRYESNYHICKTSENYTLLNTDVAQQIMRIVDRNFRSFFALIRKAKSGLYQFKQCHIPNYLPKDDFFLLVFPRVNIRNGQIIIPMSKILKKKYGAITLNIPDNIKDKIIKEVRILPKHKAHFFEIEYVYEQKEYKHELNLSKFIGIDLGLDNLATCVTNDGASFIIDGKQIKSYNRLYNKENAKLQSIKDKQGIKGTTKRQYLNLRKRNRRINHAISVASSKIIKYCIEHKIGNLVVGYNSTWKKEINIGKINNQNFTQIPHSVLRSKLQYMCELHGIKYIEQEESYTSKASFFDDDQIPSCNADNPQEYEFSGKRITRGQYRTRNGYVFNADVNGALNILRKCKLVSLSALQNSGCVSQPCRIKLF